MIDYFFIYVLTLGLLIVSTAKLHLTTQRWWHWEWDFNEPDISITQERLLQTELNPLTKKVLILKK